MALADDEAFPFEAVRDLLGVVRALYAAAQLAGASKTELAKIGRVGRELTQAIELAVSSRPGTVGYRAAFERAEVATRRAGDLVDALTPAEPLVAAARGRVVGPMPALRKKRDER